MFAEAHFSYRSSMSDGTTRGAHLEQAAKTKGITVEELLERSGVSAPPPTVPPEWEWIWSAFRRLSLRRSHGFGAPLPIPYSEVGWFAHLHGLRFSAWDLQILDMLDRQFLKTWHENKDR